VQKKIDIPVTASAVLGTLGIAPMVKMEAG